MYYCYNKATPIGNMYFLLFDSIEFYKLFYSCHPNFYSKRLFKIAQKRKKQIKIRFSKHKTLCRQDHNSLLCDQMFYAYKLRSQDIILNISPINKYHIFILIILKWKK